MIFPVDTVRDVVVAAVVEESGWYGISLTHVYIGGVGYIHSGVSDCLSDFASHFARRRIQCSVAEYPWEWLHKVDTVHIERFICKRNGPIDMRMYG